MKEGKGGKKTYKSGISQEFLDEKTGTLHRQYVVHEEIEGFVDVKLPKKGRFNNGAFITVFQKTMFDISTKANLSKGEMQLLLYLLSTTGIDNAVCTNFDIIVSDLGVNKGNLSRHLKGLVDRKIVIKNKGNRGQGVRYVPMELSINYDQLNYDLGYNGKIKDYNKKKFNHPEIEAKTTKELEDDKPNLFNSVEKQ